MSEAFRKIVVVGLDGLEPTIVEELMARGLLPNLASLRDRGGFARVATTAPAQTPVAWSSFATGVNPGGHGVFDFLRRDPRTYLPDLALNRHEQKNAFSPPRAVNLRRGKPIWSRLAEAGIPASVLRCPCAYPPDPVQGRLLSGMGVPDLRGGLGTATYYGTAEGITPGESERVVHLHRDADGSFSAALIGPRHPRTHADVGLDFTIEPNPTTGTARFRCPGARPETIELTPGRWSDWVRLKFKLGLLQSWRGMVRLLLVRNGPALALYASPINFDPEAPPFPISNPPDYAGELAVAIGPYHTTGMVEDHAGLSNGRFDETAFLDQCDLVWREREAMMLHELERLDEGLFYVLFDTPDRVQHLFWRFLEPDHPAHQGRTPNGEFAGVIEAHYRRADAVVGSALQFTDERTLTIVLSDHGFGSFRRCVDLNAWLLENGLLALRDGLRPGPEAGDLLRAVDWSRTRAYAVGLGGIYLNLQGREAAGIVPIDEAESLKAAIAQRLTGLADPQGGTVAVRSVHARESLYSGPCVGEAPDLSAFFERGHRVSWSTPMGGVGESVFSDNTNAWSGDHIVDPALVPGVLLMDRPFRGGGARLIDLAPTILGGLGLTPEADLEGENLR